MNEGEIGKLRAEEPMTIVAIPVIVVRKTVDIGVQAVIVHVHVDHENV